MHALPPSRFKSLQEVESHRELPQPASPSLESLMLMDLQAWRWAKDVIKRAREK
jgi:hypothetical protein